MEADCRRSKQCERRGIGVVLGTTIAAARKLGPLAQSEERGLTQ
jgi:hypothetical protein